MWKILTGEGLSEAEEDRISDYAAIPAAGGRHRRPGRGERHSRQRDRREDLRGQDREVRSQDRRGCREGGSGGRGAF